MLAIESYRFGSSDERNGRKGEASLDLRFFSKTYQTTVKCRATGMVGVLSAKKLQVRGRGFPIK